MESVPLDAPVEQQIPSSQSKPEEPKAAATQPPIVRQETISAPTDAEKKLKEDANKAKTELMQDMKKYETVEISAKDEQEEPEDPRVTKFMV